VCSAFIIIVIIITYLLTANELTLGGSRPYTSTDKTDKQYKNTVKTIQKHSKNNTKTQ
jgi:hypothetical protein